MAKVHNSVGSHELLTVVMGGNFLASGGYRSPVAQSASRIPRPGLHHISTGGHPSYFPAGLPRINPAGGTAYPVGGIAGGCGDSEDCSAKALRNKEFPRSVPAPLVSATDPLSQMHSHGIFRFDAREKNRGSRAVEAGLRKLGRSHQRKQTSERRFRAPRFAAMLSQRNEQALLHVPGSNVR